MQNRVNFKHSLAGDSIQLLKTREYLAKLGITARIDTNPTPSLNKYDIIHLFNIMPVEETYQQFQNARRQGKKMTLSPIFWDPREFLDETNQTGNFDTWWRETMPLRQEILDGVEAILPNSYLELENLKKTFHVTPPVYIVPNAADRFFASARPEGFIKKYKRQDFLLSVGRICRRKNQLNLIKAAKLLKIPLVIIGAINDSPYYQECRQTASGEHVLFIDVMNPEDLASAYAAARVHALVSWYDTPGLVSLEAALAGCNIVSTDRGSPREYFGDFAFYCDPSVDSIAGAVKKAWHTQKNTALKEKVLMNFTWEQTASLTYQVYQKVLDSKSKA